MKRLLAIGAIALLGAAACTTPPAGGGVPTWPAPGCYSGLFDLDYFGPMETLNNAQIMTSGDGTCSGSVQFGPVTVFPAVDEWDAIDKCTDFLGTGTGNVLDLSTQYAIPSGYWGCWQ